jgi:hypothetical protein
VQIDITYSDISIVESSKYICQVILQPHGSKFLKKKLPDNKQSLKKVARKKHVLNIFRMTLNKWKLL